MADAAYDASLGEAYSLLSRRELGKATESFRILLKQTPGSAEVNFGLGKALARQKLSAGETYLRKAIDLDPSLVEARVELGHLMRTLRRKDDAIEAYKGAIELSPDHVPALLALSGQLKGRSLVFEAETLLQRAVDLAPRNVQAQVQFGELLSFKGDWDKAEQVLRRAVEIGPKSARAAFALGRVFSGTNRYAEAVRWFEQAVQLDSSYSEARKELLAVRQLMRGNKPARRRPAVWPSKTSRFDDVEKVVRDFVLADYRPVYPILTRATRVSALGSCFAGHVSQRLQDRGVSVFYKNIGEDINSTYANRYLLDWIVGGPVDSRTAELETIYGGAQRAEFRQKFSASDIFVFTLGVAPAYFSRESGEFVLAHGGSTENKLLPQVCEFRTTTVAENLANMRHIIRSIRSLSPGTRFVLTVSPVPLLGTYEMGSAVIADTLSKATLRLTVDELLRSGDEGLYYWPSFEIVRWLGAHLTAKHPPVYGADDGYSRHVSVWLVDLIMKLFIEYFGDETVQAISRETAA